MKQLYSWALGVVIVLVSTLLSAADIDLADFNTADGFNLANREDGLSITWNSPEGEAFIDLQFIPRQGNNAAEPLIRAMGIDGEAAIEGVDPNYLFWV